MAALEDSAKGIHEPLDKLDCKEGEFRDVAEDELGVRAGHARQTTSG